MTAECTVMTVDAGEEADYEAAFRLHPVACKTVLLSEVLHDALRELCEQPGATSVVLTLSPQVSSSAARIYSRGKSLALYRNHTSAFTHMDLLELSQSTYAVLATPSLRSMPPRRSRERKDIASMVGR